MSATKPDLNKHTSDDIVHSEGITKLSDAVERNGAARVVNPLVGLSTEALYAKVAQFTSLYGFHSDEEVFRKGALAAKHPIDFETCRELSEADKAILVRERDHKWKQPFTLWFSVAVLSLGAAIQGWDNTGANGANLGFPQEFGIADRPTLVGVVNAAPLLAGVIGTWFSDPLNNLLVVSFVWDRFWVKHSRRAGKSSSGAESCKFRATFDSNLPRFTANDFDNRMGLAMSVKTSSLPMYSSEIVPAKIRGGLTMFWQLWVAFGILAGFCSNLIFYRIGNNAWRFMLGSAFAPGVPLVLLCFFCPESPRWYIKKGRMQKAWASFKRLRMTELEAARDMFYAWVQIEAEEQVFGGSTFIGRLTDLWTVARIRRASIGSMVVMLAQQFSGINIMAFYSSTIFAESGLSIRSTLLSSLGFGLVNTTFALPAIWTIDRFGRRTLLLFTFPFMAFFLFLVAGCCYIPETSGARLPLIATFIYIYTAFYSPGIGPVPNVYASESFPLSHREVGGSWAIFVNQATSTVLTMTFPDLLASAGVSGCFFFYGGLNLLALTLVFFLLPETKELTLEELDLVFSQPTRTFACYQTKTWLPYMIKRYLFQRRDVSLPPLYDLDSIEGEKTYVSVVGH